MSKLREYRLKMGITQTDLASNLGVSTRYIAFLETGVRTPSLDLAKKIADYFNVYIEDIFLTPKCTNSTQ